MNVTNTTVNTGVTNELQQPPEPPKVSPHALVKANLTARTTQRTVAEGINIENKESILTSAGLKMLLGKPTAKANIKDAMVRTLHKISDKLKSGSVGSHYKEALRLADAYQEAKTNGSPLSERIKLLNALKGELMSHAPSGPRGQVVEKLGQFIDQEIKLLEHELAGAQNERDAIGGTVLSRAKARAKEDGAGQYGARMELRGEIQALRGDDSDDGISQGPSLSHLKHVEKPTERGVPEWARKDFSGRSEKDDGVHGRQEHGEIHHTELLLQDPGLESLGEGFLKSRTFGSMGPLLDGAISSGDPEALETVAVKLLRDLKFEISLGGPLLQRAFAISDGLKFKNELLGALHEQAPDSPLFQGTYETASPEVKAFLDDAFAVGWSDTSNRQISGEKIIFEGLEFTKGKELGRGAYGAVNLYEHTREVTDRDTGNKRLVTEQVAVKKVFSGNLSDVAEEVRAHQSAMGEGHENVVNLRGVIRTPEGELLIVMDVAKSNVFDTINNLDTALRLKNKDGLTSPALSPGVAQAIRVTLFKDMLQGLLHFQETRGMTHVDVKEPNYLVGLDGRAKLTDFGTSGVGTSMDRAGSSVDNPLWKAPEVIALQRDKTRTDKIEQLRTELEEQKKQVTKELEEGPLKGKELTAAIEAAHQELDAQHQLKLLEQAPMTYTNKGDTWALGISVFKLFNGFYPFDHPKFVSPVETALLKFQEGNWTGPKVKTSKEEEIAPKKELIRDLGMDEQGNSIGQGVTSLDRLLIQMLHPDPEQRPSLTHLTQHSLFDEPMAGSDEVYELIKLLSDKEPDFAKIKQLSDELGL